jgi:F5/8 type C domain/Fn3 associated
MTTGVLSWADMRRAIMLNTGFFETNQYDLDEQMKIIAGNWDGAGMSAGNLQYNFAYGDRLTELFAHLLNNHDSVVRGVFGADTTRYNEFRTVILTNTNAQKIAWGETITDYTQPSPAGHRLIEPWKTILGNLMITPECYDKYFEMMDAYYIPNALELFKQLNCTSRASLASLFDLSVNRGRYYPCNTIVWEFEKIDARTDLTEAQKETEKVRLINNRGNDTTNGITATTWKARRDAQANQGGDYYGSLYDPETQFDINQEPAIPEKVAGFAEDVKLGALEAKGLYFGETPVKSIYLGATLVGNAQIKPYLPATVPNTQFRTNPNSYLGMESGAVTIAKGGKVWIDVQNFVASRTYYTLDGWDPDETGARYTDGITFNTAGTFTLKARTYNMAGVAEAIKTLTVTVPAFTGWRYVRFVGHGDQTGVTTRLVELQALEGATNRLLNLTPLAGYTAPNGGTIGVATNGEKVHAPSYPLWWTAEGVPDLKYDLGANYMIDTINVTGYSPVTDPRTTQFKIYVSTDNTNWTQVADYSANATNQPEAGFNFPVPQG